LDVRGIVTLVNTPVTYQLEAIDVEGNPARFLDQNSLAANGLAVPVQAPPGLGYTVDFNTGILTVSPTNRITGRFSIPVATAVRVIAVDYQVVPVVIEP
jgi:hypothetical protein